MAAASRSVDWASEHYSVLLWTSVRIGVRVGWIAWACLMQAGQVCKLDVAWKNCIAWASLGSLVQAERVGCSLDVAWVAGRVGL